MARVLVTGASGFIGRAAVEALRTRGFEIHAVSSRPASVRHDGQVTWHRADLLDASAAAAIVADVQATHLLHLAWDLRPGAWGGAGAHLDWLRASLTLAERFVEAGGRRLVTAGTCAEYDWTGGVCSETSTPLVPATLYGAAKGALAQVVHAYAQHAGVSAASGRVFFTFGPGEHPDRLVAAVIRALLEGRPAECTHGRQQRDFLSVEDVGDALAALVDSTVPGPVNIGSGSPVAVSDLVGLTGELLGCPELIRLGARQLRTEEAPLVVADVTRLRTEVGWTPRDTLRSGLERTIAWWRGQQVRTAGTVQ
jgi:nucleoside-diphosphate-sugar epimerase